MFRLSLMLSMILLPTCAVAQTTQVAQPVAASPQLNPLPQTTAQPQPDQTVPFLDLNSPEISTSESAGDGIDSDLLINFGLWMVVILCLCGLTAVGLRMLNRKGVVAVGAPSGARIVDSLNLGRHRSVQLVEIGGRSVIVASDSSGIRSVVPLAEDFSESLQEASSHFEESDA